MHAMRCARPLSAAVLRARGLSSGAAAVAPLGAAFGGQHICRGIGRLSEVVAERAEGSWLFDGHGHRYLDLTSGIGVLSTGHCHPTVVRAAQEQCARLTHAQVNIVMHQPMLQLIQELLPLMPGSVSNGTKLDSFFFWNSGAEAVEAAVKLARHATGKPNVVVVQGGYHGRTFGSMALTTSKTIYRERYGPWMPGVFVTPFPYWRQMGLPSSASEEAMVDQCIQAFKLLLKQQTAPSETAAVIIEPVLGEGGYVPAPASFLRKLRALCTEHKMLLIADEVQTGFGRTGSMFAVEESDVVPDVLIMAKGIASGYPLSAIASRKAIMDTQAPGAQGGTYAGNAVACAAALATLRVFRDERLLHNVKERSVELVSALKDIAHRSNGAVAEVRGRGLMIGVEFDLDKVKPGFASAVTQACLREKLLLLSTSCFETVRFIPALNITKEELADGVARFDRALFSMLGK